MKFLWTTITVENLDESITFYTDIAGLRVLKRFTAGHGIEIAFMGNGTDNETLIELLTDRSNGAVTFGEYISVGFSTASVDDMLTSLHREGIPVYSGPAETPAMKYFCIKDPDGLLVQLFQRK